MSLGGSASSALDTAVQNSIAEGRGIRGRGRQREHERRQHVACARGKRADGRRDDDE